MPTLYPHAFNRDPASRDGDAPALMDWMPLSQRSQIREGVCTVDMTPYLNGMLADIGAVGRRGFHAYGMIPYAGTLNFSAFDNMHLHGSSVDNAVLKYTGSGVGLNFGDPANGRYGLRLENLTLCGSAAATDGVYVRNVAHCLTSNLRIVNFPRKALRTSLSNSNDFYNLRISHNERGGANTANLGQYNLGPAIEPQFGLYLDEDTAGHQTQANSFYNLIVEGASVAGIYAGWATLNQIYFGTAEGGVIGIWCSKDSAYNTFVGGDYEINSKADIFDNGFKNTFRDLLAADRTIIAGGAFHQVERGFHSTIVVQTGAVKTVCEGLTVVSYGNKVLAATNATPIRVTLPATLRFGLTASPCWDGASYSDLVIDAVTNTKITSASTPFGAELIGRTLVLRGADAAGWTGTPAAPQTVTISNVVGVVATCSVAVGTLGTGGGVGHIAGTAPYAQYQIITDDELTGSDFLGNTGGNGKYKVRVINPTTVDLVASAGTGVFVTHGSQAIATITNPSAAPSTVTIHTAAPHLLNNLSLVELATITGQTNLNTIFNVSVTGPNDFILNFAVGTGVASAGGTITILAQLTKSPIVDAGTLTAFRDSTSQGAALPFDVAGDLNVIGNATIGPNDGSSVLVDLSAGTSANDARLTLGRRQTGNRSTVIDFISDDFYSELVSAGARLYGDRMTRNTGGTNANWGHLHRGTGSAFWECLEAGNFYWTIAGTQLAQITSAGLQANSPFTLGASKLRTGAGSPNTVVVGSPGDVYLNTSGGAATTLYIKESGVATNTGWVAK